MSFHISFLFKGRPYKAIAAALLLFACRKCNMPFTIRKMWKVSKIKGKNINKCIKIIKKALPETKSYVSKPINFLMHISK